MSFSWQFFALVFLTAVVAGFGWALGAYLLARLTTPRVVR